MIHHAQPALNSQVRKTQHIRPIQAKEEQHLGSPFANPFERNKLANDLVILHSFKRSNVEGTRMDARGEVLNI